MNVKDFKAIKDKFVTADVKEKIKIYTTVEDLTEMQYKQLLKEFPLEHLNKLEKALM